jgi:hypothetical protein
MSEVQPQDIATVLECYVMARDKDKSHKEAIEVLRTAWGESDLAEARVMRLHQAVGYFERNFSDTQWHRKTSDVITFIPGYGWKLKIGDGE